VTINMVATVGMGIAYTSVCLSVCLRARMTTTDSVLSV